MTQFYTPSMVNEERLDTLLKLVVRSISKEVDARLAGCGLSDAQAIPILLIAGGRCQTATQIAGVIDVDGGAVSRMVGRLESRGILVKDRSTGDRREVRVRLSDVGLDWAHRISCVLSDVANDHLAGFATQEHQALMTLLKRLRANGRLIGW